jgi:hypothetical protein
VTDGGVIPAARQGFYSTTPDGHIREVWTSAVDHTVVFTRPSDARRYARVSRSMSSLSRKVPAYAGSPWLTRQLSRSSKLFPPPLLWAAVGVLGIAARRPRRAALALALGAAAALVTLANAMTIYPIIEFAVPLAPAFVVLGAVGLLGERRSPKGAAAHAAAAAPHG